MCKDLGVARGVLDRYYGTVLEQLPFKAVCLQGFCRRSWTSRLWSAVATSWTQAVYRFSKCRSRRHKWSPNSLQLEIPATVQRCVKCRSCRPEALEDLLQVAFCHIGSEVVTTIIIKILLKITVLVSVVVMITTTKMNEWTPLRTPVASNER